MSATDEEDFEVHNIPKPSARDNRVVVKHFTRVHLSLYDCKDHLFNPAALCRLPLIFSDRSPSGSIIFISNSSVRELDISVLVLSPRQLQQRDGCMQKNTGAVM